jgi:hypothetical protein
MTHESYRAPEFGPHRDDLKRLGKPREKMTTEELENDIIDRRSRAEKAEKGDVYSFGLTAYFVR